MSDLSKPLEHGDDVSHYRILDQLGGGGMGVVYRAEDTRLERFVALKFLPRKLGNNQESKQRFMREAKAASALDHPNICTIYDIDETDGRLFIAMACYHGETLKKRLERGRLLAEEAVEVVRQTAEGLAAAHERGIVHRDIKPANLFLVEDDSWPSGRVVAGHGVGDRTVADDTVAEGTVVSRAVGGRTAIGRVKILDFGLAKTQTDAAALTQTGLFMGTPAYMSPEQARGEALDARGDLWSLGVVFFELLSGQLPFVADNVVALIHAISDEPPRALRQLRPSISPGLESIVSKLLEKDLGQRYDSCHELLVDLERWGQGHGDTSAVTRATNTRSTQTMPSHMLPDSASPRRPPWQATMITRYVLPAALVGLVMVLGWAAIRGPWRPPPEPPATPVAVDDDARPSVAVLFFDNHTGDPDLDWLCTGLADMLVTDLSQSPDLRVLSTSRMYQILEGLELADNSQGDTALAFTVAEKIAARAGVERLILGSISRAGRTLRIDVKVQDAASAEIVTSKQVAGEGEESLFSLVDDLSFGIRQSFKLPAEDGTDLALTAVTTSSIEAYRFYVEGMRLHLDLQEEASSAQFQKAVEVDPEFAMAWAKLGVAHYNLGRSDALEHIGKALEHADRLPLVQRYYVEGIYSSGVYHRWPRAATAWEKMIEVAPHQGTPYNNLAMLLSNLERYDEALPFAEVILNRADPWVGTYSVMSEAYAAMGEFEKAVERLEGALVESENPILRLFLGVLLLRQGEFDRGAEELVTAMAKRPQPRVLLGLCAADLLRDDWQGAMAVGDLYAASEQASMRAFANYCRQFAYQQSGRPAAALAVVEEMIAAAATARERAIYRIFAAPIALEIGRFETARSHSELARREAPEQITDNLGLFYGAMAEIRLKRFESARELIAEHRVLAGKLGFKIEKRYLRRLLAELAFAEERPAAALVELEQAVSTLPPHGVLTLSHWPDHVPAWFSLAEAYLATDDRDRAAETWRRIVDATEERIHHPIPYVRSLYLLAAHHRRRGEPDRAVEYFRRFPRVLGRQ